MACVRSLFFAVFQTSIALAADLCDVSTLTDYGCFGGHCLTDGPASPPTCSPYLLLANLTCNGNLTCSILQARSLCEAHAGCHSFALYSTFHDGDLALLYTANKSGLIANAAWSVFIKGESPSPPPSPFPTGPCQRAHDCSLNGVCQAGICACHPGWQGNHCQHLKLKPIGNISAYGTTPNVTSWGATIVAVNETYHMFVTEETGGCGLSYWASNSQIVHATSKTLSGPYVKQAVVTTPATSNPQMVYNNRTNTYMLFYIGGAGSDITGPHQCRSETGTPGPWGIPPAADSTGLLTSKSPWGPWLPGHFIDCNNPSPAIHPNGTLFVACHNGAILMTRQREDGSFTPPVDIAQGHPFVPGNCEDPFLYFDAAGNFHLIAHCYVCYWYPSQAGQCKERNTTACDKGVTCSAHAFSADGLNFTWVGSDDAPYNFTATATTGEVINHSTRERPWMLLDENRTPKALINGVSPSFPQLKFVDGIDWTYTLLVEIAD